MFLESFSGSVNFEDENFFFEKVAKIMFIQSKDGKMEITRCANMDNKNFFLFVKTNITKFDTFDIKTNQIFLEKSFMVGISNFEKIFKGHLQSKIKLPIFCHGMKFRKRDL